MAWLMHQPRTLVSDPSAASRQVYRLDLPDHTLYAKVFHGLNEAHATGQGRWIDTLKWRCRPSRAMQTLRVSCQMLAAGLGCPPPVLAMRLRQRRPMDMFLSQAVDATNVSDLLEHDAPPRPHAELLRAIAPHVARLHQRRFLHGDLLPRNLHVSPSWDHLHFMDNDRTRRWPCPLPTWVKRRNLVQFCYRVCNILGRDHGVIFMDAYGQAMGWRQRKLAYERRQVLDKAMARAAAFRQRMGLPPPM